MFPEEILGVQLRSKIYIYISFLIGSIPTSRGHYFIRALDLVELKLQIKEMMEKGYLKPSTSPLRSLILFLKKKDGTLILCID